jgi:Chitobiase/beta-hexosaminidase C-terminal domain
MSDQVLETTEADMFGILSATPSLALAKIIRADEGLTEADVAQKLVTLTGTEKIGLGIVVLPAEVVAAEKNQPGPPLRISASCQVIEAVLANRGASGTGIKASVAALRVLGALNNQMIGNRVLYADRNPVEPLPGKKGYVTYLVTLFSEANGSADVGRVGQLAFALDESGGLLITTATAGAAIYYTTDGSFPGPSNDVAGLCDGAIEIEDGMVLRACAFLSPLNPADISEVRISIGGTITLNGEVVTAGGQAVYP